MVREPPLREWHDGGCCGRGMGSRLRGKNWWEEGSVMGSEIPRGASE